VNSGKSLFADGDRVGFEFVRGDALRRKTLLLEQLSQQSPRRLSAASWLDQEFQNFTFVVDRPPQPMSPAADPDDHFVEVPASTGARTAAAKNAGDKQPKLQKPAPDGLD